MSISFSCQVLKQDDGQAIGDEILFLTDGEAGDDVNVCLQEAVDSGAIINTIALGPSADIVLTIMADKTGQISEGHASLRLRVTFVILLLFCKISF